MYIEEYVKVDHTMTEIQIRKDRGDVSVSKLFCTADQSLFDGLVAGQDHHFIGPKVDREYRTMFL